MGWGEVWPSIWQGWQDGWRRSRLGRSLLALLTVGLLLTGCVDYDVTIHFDSPQRGELVQHLRLDEGFQGMDAATTRQWFRSLQQKTRQLGGTVRQRSRDEVELAIPFWDAHSLETAFAEFWQVATTPPVNSKRDLTLPAIAAQLDVTRRNFLLLEWSRLHYTIDLRSLGLSSADGNVLVGTRGLVNLTLAVTTPWGARTVGDTPTPTRLNGQSQPYLWQLVPGQKNEIEITFWMPNGLGLGTLLIGVAIALGLVLKQSRSDRAQPSDPPSA